MTTKKKQPEHPEATALRLQLRATITAALVQGREYLYEHDLKNLRQQVDDIMRRVVDVDADD